MATPQAGVRLNQTYQDLINDVLGPRGTFADGTRALLLLGASVVRGLTAPHAAELAKLLAQDLHPDVLAALRELYISCCTPGEQLSDTTMRRLESFPEPAESFPDAIAPGQEAAVAASPWAIGFDV